VHRQTVRGDEVENLGCVEDEQQGTKD